MSVNDQATLIRPAPVTGAKAAPAMLDLRPLSRPREGGLRAASHRTHDVARDIRRHRGGARAAPADARAQPRDGMRRPGVLMGGSDDPLGQTRAASARSIGTMGQSA
jgi:hypothetical protein